MNNQIRGLSISGTDRTTYFMCFLVILLTGIFLRVSFFSGLVFDDSVAIAERSWDLFSENELAGEFSQFKTELRQTPTEQNLLVLVTGFLYRLIGVSDFSSIIFPVFSSVAISVLLFVIGKLWFGESVGILAMFFWFLLPIGIFLSTNLFSVLPMIALNTLAVASFFVADEKRSAYLYALSGALFLVGFVLDWTYFFASAALVVFYLSKGLAPQTRGRIGIVLSAGAILYVLVPPNGSTAVNLYYLVSLVFENLLLFPLLIIGVVYAGLSTNDKRPATLLTWLAAKSLFLILGSRWISETPIVENIGMSGYWLDLLVPGLLLIAWLFVSRIEKFSVPGILIGANVIVIVLFLGIRYFDPNLAALFTVSRVFFGLSLLLIALYLAVWNASNRLRFSVYVLFLVAFLIGSLTITNDYWRSYRFATDDADEVLSSLEAEDEIILHVMQEELFSRFSYLKGFEDDRSQTATSDLNVIYLKRANSDTASPGSYVVITENYRNFILGNAPGNWSLKQTISSSDQQKLLLYRVNP